MGVTPSGIDGNPHLVFIEVYCPAVEAYYACGGAARDFVQARALCTCSW